MNILYVSRMMSEEAFSRFFNTISTKPSQSMKFHRLLAEGLANNNNIKIKAISDYPVSRKISKKLFLKGYKETINKINYEYLSTINIKFIRNIISFINSFFKTFTYLKRNKNSVIITDVLCQSLSMGSLFACKLLKKKCIAVVTDLPDMLYDKKTHKKINNDIIIKYDGYVFLTEYMNDYINKKRKPYVIIEGIADNNMANIENKLENKYEINVVIYAGSLKKIYGIDVFIKAFIKANITNSELHIYGAGDYEEEIKQLCLDNNNIKYFGVRENQYIVQEQLKAILLINPRPSDMEYTKYSFPSKNMEYMASGTPILTTKLSGMPKEYFDYIYLLEDETVEGMAEEIKKILCKPREELHKKGLSAKQFVIEYKNNIVQALNIENLIKKVQMGYYEYTVEF